MGPGNVKESSQSVGRGLYGNKYHRVIIILMGLMIITIVAIAMVLYQVINRPAPVFMAVQPNGQKMQLVAYDDPNLLPETLLNWACKAATLAYSFDFTHYENQLALAKPYFTDGGWANFRDSITSVISRVVSGQLVVNGVVTGEPVISNQGPLPGKGYAWRVVIPFLVTYQTAQNTSVVQHFYVTLTIVHVPTSVNPQGIGIDQFVMTRA